MAQQAPEYIFSQPFNNDARVEFASIRVDKLDDFAHKVVDPIQSAKAFYTSNSSTLNAAGRALINLNESESFQKAAKDVLAPVRKIIDGLDDLSKVHPFVAVGVLLFKAVIELEIKRRENDKKTLSLVLQMADMMGTLLQLKEVKDPDLKTASGETVTGRMQLLMKKIETDVKNCGQTIDAYRKQHVMAKFIKSPIWNDRLIAIGNGFTDRKTEITFALSIHTAVGVDAIGAQTKEMQATLDMVLKAVVEQKSPEELEWDRELNKLGGWKACMADPEKMAQFAKAFADKAGDGKPSKGEASNTSNRSFSNDILSPSLKRDLAMPVDILIEENSGLYERKLKAQTEQITDAITNSTMMILSKLDAGPHEKLKHPVLRHIWEEMKWRSSVKARTFILALFDFYIDQYVAANISSLLPLADSTEDKNLDFAEGDGDDDDADAPSNVPSAPKPEKTSSELIHDPTFDWCIQYLNIQHVPLLMEAFDDDASGWVKISEANSFTDAIPDGWKLLQFIVYWCVGWRAGITKYSRRIIALTNELLSLTKQVRTETTSGLVIYLNGYSFGHMFKLVSAPSEWNVPNDGDLMELVDDRMDMNIKKWDDLLQSGKYEIESMDSVSQLSGGRRIESFFYPLMYVLLRHHVQIVRVGKAKVLSDRELESAAESIDYVMDAVWDRKTAVEESFRQQRLSTETQLKYFACGFFSLLSPMDEMPSAPNVDPLPTDPDFLEEVEALSTLAPPSVDQLRFPTGGLDQLGYETELFDPELSTFKAEDGLDKTMPKARALWKLAIDAVLAQVKSILERHTWDFIKRRRDIGREFFKLSLKYEVYYEMSNYGGNHVEDTEGPLTDAEDDRLSELEGMVSKADYDFHWSRVRLEFRKRRYHEGIGCDGCGASPLWGTRYRCVQCEDFDFCPYCHRNPLVLDKESIHLPDHDMIRIAWPLPRGPVAAYKKRAEEILKVRAQPKDTTKRHRKKKGQAVAEGAGANNDEDGSESGSESGDESGEESNDEEVPKVDVAEKSEEEDPVTSNGDGVTSAVTEDVAENAEVRVSDNLTAVPKEPNSTQEDGAVEAKTEAEAETLPNSSKHNGHRTFSCQGGCGRDDLTLHYLCLDCEDEYVLCAECDAAFIKGDLINSAPPKEVDDSKTIESGAKTSPAEVSPAEGAQSVNGDSTEEAADASVPSDGKGGETGVVKHEDQEVAKHHMHHVILIIKHLGKKDKAAKEENMDATVLINQLRSELTAQLGEVRDHVDQLEGKFDLRFAKIENMLAKLAEHLGISPD